MSSVSVTVSGVMLRGVEQVCRDYALVLLKSVSDVRGMSVESLLEGVDFPRLVSDVPKSKREKREKVAKVVGVKKSSLDLPSVVLPFLGVLDGCCKGVIRNHNLYTQCHGVPKSDDLCSKCVKCKDSGKFLGLISDRVVGEIEFNTGSKVVKIGSYVDVMRKLNIEKDAAVSDALRFGWTLGDEYFEEKEKARGRPKKDKKDDGDDKKDKSRGRPKKDKKVVSNGNGDDLIAKLVAEVSNDDKCSSSSSAEDDDEVQVPADVPKVAAVSMAPAAKKKTSKADKEAEKAAKEAAKEAAKAAKEAEKLKKEAEKAAKEAEKAAKLADKKKAKSPSPPPPPAAAAASLSEEEEESEEDVKKVVTVKKFDFGGKRYKLSSENILYDWDTEEPVGVWNADKKCIDEYENSSDEESDDE